MRKLRLQRVWEEIHWQLTLFWIDLSGLVLWTCLAILLYALFTGGK